MFKRRLQEMVLSPIVGLAIAAPVSGAYAQTDGEGRGGVLDTVIVTAERREEDIQKVPLAVTALSGAQLDQQQIVSTLDLARVVPNLTAANNVGLGGAVMYFMRGVGNTESIATFDLPIGTYVDEVYVSRQSGNQIALSGVERVEVLRGPQGTLFGRNTTGGAVQVITKKPGDEFEGEAEVGFGRFDRVLARAAVNAPLSDSLAVRVSGLYIDDNGYTENTLNDDRFNDERTWGVRGAVRFDPNDTLLWDVSAQFIEQDGLAIGTPEILDPDTLQGTREEVTGDLHRVRLNDRNCEPEGPVETWFTQGCTFSEVKSTLLVSNLGLDFGFGALNLITGYYDQDFSFNIDFLGNTTQPVFGGLFGANFTTANAANTRQISQEVKWSSSLFDGRFEYVAGFFFMDEDNETFFADFVNLPFMGTTLPTTLVNRAPLENGTRSYAVYGQGDFAITDRLTLQAGLRWTEEDKEISLDGTSLDFGSFSNVPLDSAALQSFGIPLKQTVARVTPRAALYYDISDDIRAYASYTQGFKSGGWNVRGAAAIEFQSFGPEEVESYEIGLRTESFDNRLRFNVTLFHATYDDFQIPTVFPGTNNFLTLNSGEARVRGVEIAFLAAATEGLQIYGNIRVQDADYTALSPGAEAAGIGPELSRTPTLSGLIGANQSFYVGDGHALTIGGDVSYTGAFEHLPANDPSASVDSQVLVNAQAAWTLPGENLTLIAECSNCADNVHLTQSLFNVRYSNQPRRWGVRAKYDF